jgi:hypothetical protein
MGPFSWSKPSARRRLMAGLRGGLSALAFLAPLPASAATTYYVAPGGKDSAAGSVDAPWASIGHAQTVAVAGDTVYFRAGKYVYTAGLKA